VATAVDEFSKSWDQLPDEPDLWYKRFMIFRDMGPERTIQGAFKIVKARQGFRSNKAGESWTTAAHDYNWRERANDWDTQQRARVGQINEDRRFHASEQRLRLINHLLMQAFDAIQSADLDNMTPAQARKMLPTLRQMYKDMLAAQRLELGEPDSVAELREANGGAGSMSGEAMLEALQRLDTWVSQQEKQRGAMFLLDTGAGGAGLPYLESLKGSRSANFVAIPEVFTPHALKKEMKEVRDRGLSVRYVQFAGDWANLGLDLGDGAVLDFDLLRELCAEAEILLLIGNGANDASIQFEEHLQYVVVLGDIVDFEGSRRFADGFWTAISDGMGLSRAANLARVKLSPVMRGQVAILGTHMEEGQA
jgi:hypothetical protein